MSKSITFAHDMNTEITKKKFFAAALALGTAVPSWADTALADSSRVYDLDEVVVVSQNKEYQKLRQQPLSSTVLTSNELTSLGIRDVRELSDYVPSLAMPQYGARYTSSIYVRGIGSRLNEPSMGIYIDNIPLVNKAAFNSHLYETDRVDVLRGPQGTLYGINTEGGLIRMFTRNPMDYQGTDIRLSVGTHFYRKAELAHYHRFGDRLALSVAAFYNGQNGFFRNLTTGERADKSNEGGGRLRLVWQPSKRLRIDLTGDYQHVKQNGFAYGLLDDVTARATQPATNPQSDYLRHLLNTGLSVKYAGDQADVNYTLSWQYLKDDMTMDIDYRPENYLMMQQQQLQNALTHELVHKTHQIGAWQGTTGFFFSHQWLKTVAPVGFGTEMNRFLSKQIEDYAYYGMLNSMAKRMGQEAAAATIARAGGVHITMEMQDIPGRFYTPQTNYGFFHESNIKLTDRLTATLGLRYDVAQSRIDYNTSAVASLDESVMGTRVQAMVSSLLEHSEEASFEQWLPKIALTYRLDRSGSNIYAIVSKGYRAGGFNIQMFSDILQAEMRNEARTARGAVTIEHDMARYNDIRNTIMYKPEESWNYEAGTHLNLWGNRLHMDLSAYYMQIRNQQLSVFATQYNFGRAMVNAGKSYSCGIEATLRGSAADNRLNWSVGYGYTRAVFKEYQDTIVIDDVETPVDYQDKRVPFVPEHTLSANADYRFDIGGSLLQSVTVGAGVTAQGRLWWDEANTYGQKFYAVGNARVEADMKTVKVGLWARNLTNTNYNTFAVESKVGGSMARFAQRGNPFQMGVDVNIHF